MFYFKPSAYSAVAVVPAEIIKNRLKTASGDQTKVILAACLFAAEGFDTEKLSSVTGLSAAECEDCLEYWADEGIILRETELKSPIPEKKETPEESKTPMAVPAEKKDPELRPELPTRKEIAARLLESKQVRDLFNEVQRILGRTIGVNDQAILLLLSDYYGLAPEIILLLCEYQRVRGQANNMSGIKAMGISWAKREINTIDAANTEIARLENEGKLWPEFLKATDSAFPAKPTDVQKSTLAKWVDDWKLSFDVIKLAYEEMKNNGTNPNIRYMDKVLASWYSSGATTPERIAALKRNIEESRIAAAEMKKRRGSDRQTDGNSGASYDIEKAKAEAETGRLVVKKRGK